MHFRDDLVQLFVEHGSTDDVKLGLEAFVQQLERLDVDHVAGHENGADLGIFADVGGAFAEQSDRLELLMRVPV